MRTRRDFLRRQRMTEPEKVSQVSAPVEVVYVTSTEDPRPWIARIKEYRQIGRYKCPAETGGPWNDEPDRIEWIDPQTGYPCLMRRGWSASWCGYVCVPADHILHGVGYDAFEEDIMVHGGVTFAGSVSEHEREDHEDQGDWWFGFDCGHGGADISPGMPTFGPTMMGETYKDVAWVKTEVTWLASQLHAKAVKP